MSRLQQLSDNICIQIIACYLILGTTQDFLNAHVVEYQDMASMFYFSDVVVLVKEHSYTQNKRDLKALVEISALVQKYHEA